MIFAIFLQNAKYSLVILVNIPILRRLEEIWKRASSLCQEKMLLLMHFYDTRKLREVGEITENTWKLSELSEGFTIFHLGIWYEFWQSGAEKRLLHNHDSLIQPHNEENQDWRVPQNFIMPEPDGPFHDQLFSRALPYSWRGISAREGCRLRWPGGGRPRSGPKGWRPYYTAHGESVLNKTSRVVPLILENSVFSLLFSPVFLSVDQATVPLWTDGVSAAVRSVSAAATQRKFLFEPDLFIAKTP